jgi:NADP-dependent 3-hydroxy acid dehydrogenase YdfG
MSKWIITGASGSVATECMKILIEENINIDAFSRTDLRIENKLVNFTKVPSYNEINFDVSECECILVAQGFFDYKLIAASSNEEIDNLIEANFVSQIKSITSFLKKADTKKRINVAILGSTNAYEAGSGTAIYGACKAGILALVKALNNEYTNSDVRFCLISFGTLSNEMGSKVPNQVPDSLLDVKFVAEELVKKMTNEGNSWQPEIIIRRRHIKTLS